MSFLNNIEKAWRASSLFSSDVIENAKHRLILFDQGRLRREIKETAQQPKRFLGVNSSFMNCVSFLPPGWSLKVYQRAL
ncbi:MAG: hypothetical protein ACP5NQ_10125 [Vulcanisaeta sp.]